MQSHTIAAIAEPMFEAVSHDHICGQEFPFRQSNGHVPSADGRSAGRANHGTAGTLQQAIL